MLIETVPEIYVITMTIIISKSYRALEEILNHLNSLKPKSRLGYNIIDLCNEILVGAECLESARSFKYSYILLLPHGQQ